MRAITPQLAGLIERLKRENPHRTGTTLLRELALSSGQDDPPLSSSTLYRFLQQRGLSERELLAPQARKKFEAAFANQIWQADMLFGPWVARPGGGRRQVFLHATLDDASRLIPHAQFYASQGWEACLDCLRQAMAARGIPIRLYIDNAKMYHSSQLARIAASLGTLIIHSRPYQPEGRGKIERCFRTVRERYADDAIVHCRTEAEAQKVRAALAARLRECGLVFSVRIGVPGSHVPLNRLWQAQATSIPDAASVRKQASPRLIPQ
jgi:transposase InsO family protein